jgi:sec-independent protein translocase protein TatA
MRLGIGEIVVVLALALLFFGPSKLPQLGSSLGQAIKSFKKGLNSLHEDIEAGPSSPEETKGLAGKGEGSASAPAASNAVAAPRHGSDSAS